jgi:hypothetical protein
MQLLKKFICLIAEFLLLSEENVGKIFEYKSTYFTIVLHFIVGSVFITVELSYILIPEFENRKKRQSSIIICKTIFSF